MRRFVSTPTTRVTKSKEIIKEGAREGVIHSAVQRRFDKRLPEAPEVTSALVETNKQGGGRELLLGRLGLDYNREVGILADGGRHFG